MEPIPTRGVSTLVLAAVWCGAAFAAGAPAQCTTQWSPGGLAWSANGIVTSAVIWDPDGPGPASEVLVVGGRFTLPGTSTVTHIASRDPATGLWSPLGAGTNDTVYALQILPNGELMVGGNFTVAGGIAASAIAAWNGTTWMPVGGGVTGGSPVSVVRSLVRLPNGDVVASGIFAAAGGITAPNIARWNGSSWSSLGAGLGPPAGYLGVSSVVVRPNGELVAGGSFSTSGGFPAAIVARWNGAAWSPIGSMTGGLFSGTVTTVSALAALPNGDVVATGNFTAVGGTAAESIARWNGTAWAPLGAGIVDGLGTGSGTGVGYALALLPDGDLLVGGVFAIAGGTAANCIARWNGAAWTSFGSGAIGGVYHLALQPDAALTVGGQFVTAGGLASPNLARLATTCPTQVTTVGTGCVGAGGPDVLAASTQPWTGSVFRARATGMPPLGMLVAVSGFTPIAVPLPLLLPQALPGCTLFSTPDVIELMLPAAGAGQTALPIPDDPTLAGFQFLHQFVAFETNAQSTTIAVTSTNALQVTLGSF